MQPKKIYLLVLTVAVALIVIGGICLAMVPTSQVEANGVHLKRYAELLPPTGWGFYTLDACGPNNSFTRTSYGVIGVCEERWWKAQKTAP